MSVPKSSRSTAAPAPQSWEFDTWPEGIWPNDPDRAKWVCRAYRKELTAAKALSRVGYKIVVLGAPYARWLEGRANQVVEFKSNNPRIGELVVAREPVAVRRRKKAQALEGALDRRIGP